jgi:hypothetical protein
MSNLVDEFRSVTQASSEVAERFLSLAGGDLNGAVNIYFQNKTSSTVGPASPSPRQTRPPPPAPANSPAKPPRRQFDVQQTFQALLSHRLPGQCRQEPSDIPFERHKITLWRNGFRLDGGKFRPITEPKNQQFLVAVSAEQVPAELMKPGIEVDLEVEDETESDYPEPAPNSTSSPRRSVSQPQQQQSPAPAHQQQLVPPPAQQQAGTRPAPHNPQQGAEPATEKSTNIKLWFPDQSSLVLTVTLEETVGDIRRHITQIRPELRSRRFKLDVRPSGRPLLNDSATVVEADLRMAQVNVVF